MRGARFWHPIAIATLNETPERAAAGPFVEVLARAFFGRRADSQFVLPAVGLSELYTDDAQRFIEARGGRVETRARVTGLDMREDRLEAVRLATAAGSQRAPASSPCRRARWRRSCPTASGRADRWRRSTSFETSPIVSTHLWFDRPVLDVPFVGLLGTTTQWVFDRTALTGERGADGGSASAR